MSSDEESIEDRLPSKSYRVDPRFRGIATRPRDYTKEELEEIGFEKNNKSDYILFC